VDILQALLYLIAGEVILILLLLKVLFCLGVVGVLLWAILQVAKLLGFKPKRKRRLTGLVQGARVQFSNERSGTSPVENCLALDPAPGQAQPILCEHFAAPLFSGDAKDKPPASEER